ncbi:rod shape-determining protein MreC [Streptococcus sp. X16XC17]|uniref:rod shape-determining protein MreC n=1 Tax=unclassified Streptococcus TaxID=2608887 RepID=UPI00066FC964|nr:MULTISPECIES: rod shape-determining protein MreC [unclassified Streptococcus]TCD45898.1 rod shape-determining protein MreC [Streptococcus sp. X16XC17]
MNQYKKSRLIVTSSVLLVVSLSFLYLSTQIGFEIPVLSNVVRSGVSSVNAIISRPVQHISSKVDELSHLMNVYNENIELKQTFSELKNTNSENESLKKENESLRKSIDFETTFPEKHLMDSLVVVRYPTTWNEQVVIDQGAENGIEEGMLVVANGGLAGIVDQVSNHSAGVRLFSNSVTPTKIAIKVLVDNTIIYGILSGYLPDQNVFVVTQLNSNVPIPEGSTVVTSDLAGHLASNLPVGTVKSSKVSSSNLNSELYVQPAIDFSSIYSMTVVGEQ